MQESVKLTDLQTDTFLLRPMLVGDAQHFWDLIDMYPDLMRYSLTPCTHKEEVEKYVYDALNAGLSGKAIPYTVIDKRTTAIVGTTRFYDFQPKNNSTLLGYTWYAENYHGSGINTHCKYLMLDFAFSHLELERVEFRVDARNARSISAIQKIGGVKEGVLRSHLPVADGSRRDTVVFSILKEEWNERVNSLLLDRLRKIV